MSVNSVALGHLVQFNPPTPKGLLASQEEVAIVPMASVSELGTMETKEYRPAREVNAGLSYFSSGDILIAKITPCYENNKITVASVDRKHAFGSTEFHVARPDRARLDPRYLLHFLRQDWVRATGTRRMTGSGGQRRVPKAFLEELKIPLPSLDEQQRIAAILDQADELRRQRQETLTHSQRLMSSIFESHFPTTNRSTSEMISLGNLADIQVGHAFKSAKYTEEIDGVRLCRGANVLPGRLDWQDLARWPAMEVGPYSHLELRVGDIIVAMDRPWISEGFKIARVRPSDLPALLVQRVARIRASEEDLGLFLFHLLRQPGFTRHCRPTETTVPHISPKEIRGYVVSRPSKTVLEAFASEARLLTVYEARQREQLTCLDALFASLQHCAFRGELTGGLAECALAGVN